MAKVYTESKIIEYAGTLPVTIKANGSTLADYRIYGAAGGVGDDGGTAYGYVIPMAVQGNVYVDKNKGLYGYTINPYNNSITPNSSWWVSGYIPVVEGATYTGVNTGQDTLLYSEIGGMSTGISGLRNGLTIPQGKHYMRLNVSIVLMNSFTVSVKYPSTPIYIGDEPLSEDEYISYGEQKIYRMVGGVPAPTDPPVPLPALPTNDGVTITDYTGQSTAPSQMYIKYNSFGEWGPCGEYVRRNGMWVPCAEYIRRNGGWVPKA